MSTNIVNFYIDYENGTTQKLSSEVEDAQLAGLGSKGKLWRTRIMNENSDLVYPYAWFFFSRPVEGYGYTMGGVPGMEDTVKELSPEYLYHAKDCRLTSTVTDETTIFGIWEV